MLTVGNTADTLETVTLDNALESLAFGDTCYVNPVDFPVVKIEVTNGDSVTQIHLGQVKTLELDKFAFGSGSCLFEMALEGLAGVFLRNFVIGKLYSGITIFFYCTNLRNNTRSSLNDGAGDVFSVCIEERSHSDFLSN